MMAFLAGCREAYVQVPKVHRGRRMSPSNRYRSSVIDVRRDGAQIFRARGPVVFFKVLWLSICASKDVQPVLVTLVHRDCEDLSFMINNV